MKATITGFPEFKILSCDITVVEKQQIIGLHEQPKHEVDHHIVKIKVTRGEATEIMQKMFADDGYFHFSLDVAKVKTQSVRCRIARVDNYISVDVVGVTIETDTPMEEQKATRLPIYFSVPVNGSFHKSMLANKLSKHECYRHWLDLGWTDDILVEDGILIDLTKPKKITAVKMLNIDGIGYYDFYFSGITTHKYWSELVDHHHKDNKLKGGQKSDGTWFLIGIKK